MSPAAEVRGKGGKAWTSRLGEALQRARRKDRRAPRCAGKLGQGGAREETGWQATRCGRLGRRDGVGGNREAWGLGWVIGEEEGIGWV